MTQTSSNVLLQQLSLADSQSAPSQAGSALSVLTVSAISPYRKQLETFIANGYATAFNAHICHFLPVLVGIEHRGVRAALGVRSASQPLFVEQYLNDELTNCLAAAGIDADRQHTVEVGNLFSASSRYTLPLMLAVSTSLFISGYRYVVFTATKRLRELLSGNGLALTVLADASEACLKEPKDDWGSYYQTQPQVCALAVEDVVRLMLAQPTLRRLWSQVADQLEPLNQQLRCLA